MNTTPAPAAIPSRQREMDAGRLLGGMIRALAAGKGDLDRAVSWSRKNHSDPVTRALMASDAAAGGTLIAPDYSAEMIPYLRANSAFRKLNPRLLPMESGLLHMPKGTGGATASYVGESSNIGKTQPTSGDVNLTARTLAALVPVSNNLLNRTRGGADEWVRDDVTQAVNTRADLAFIRGDGTENTPKGVRSWCQSANQIAANGTVNLANVITDLKKLIDALESADIQMRRPGWLMNPREKNYLMFVQDSNGNFVFRDEMREGTLFGYPYEVTTQIPKNLGVGTNESEVYLVDFFEAVLGETEALMIDASSAAAYHDGSQVQAAFSRNETVIRAVVEHDLAMRHVEAIAMLTGTKWGA